MFSLLSNSCRHRIRSWQLPFPAWSSGSGHRRSMKQLGYFPACRVCRHDCFPRRNFYTHLTHVMTHSRFPRPEDPYRFLCVFSPARSLVFPPFVKPKVRTTWFPFSSHDRNLLFCGLRGVGTLLSHLFVNINPFVLYVFVVTFYLFFSRTIIRGG